MVRYVRVWPAAYPLHVILDLELRAKRFAGFELRTVPDHQEANRGVGLYDERHRPNEVGRAVNFTKPLEETHLLIAVAIEMSIPVRSKQVELHT